MLYEETFMFEESKVTIIKIKEKIVQAKEYL
jgi:hypothetical protein